MTRNCATSKNYNNLWQDDLQPLANQTEKGTQSYSCKEMKSAKNLRVFEKDCFPIKPPDENTSPAALCHSDFGLLYHYKQIVYNF